MKLKKKKKVQSLIHSDVTNTGFSVLKNVPQSCQRDNVTGNESGCAECKSFVLSLQLLCKCKIIPQLKACFKKKYE